jgi:hypothetical protein
VKQLKRVTPVKRSRRFRPFSRAPVNQSQEQTAEAVLRKQFAKPVAKPVSDRHRKYSNDATVESEELIVASIILGCEVKGDGFGSEQYL